MSEFSPYLRLIQKSGFTRHPGGLEASDTLLSRAHINKNSHILDVGCGAGHTMSHIVKNYGCRVTGVDISEDALSRAEGIYQKEPEFLKFTFKKASVENLPFADNSFDVVLCESVLVFVNDKAKALREMARVTKVGGFLAINELCQGEGQSMTKYFARPEFKGFLSEAKDLIKPLEKDFSMILYDEKSLKFAEQITAIKQWASPNGILQILEGFHQILTNQESRSDFLKIAKLSLSLPKDAFNHLNWLLLLMQKN